MPECRSVSKVLEKREEKKEKRKKIEHADGAESSMKKEEAGVEEGQGRDQWRVSLFKKPSEKRGKKLKIKARWGN
jgi:hypothetical protein